MMRCICLQLSRITYLKNNPKFWRCTAWNSRLYYAHNEITTTWFLRILPDSFRKQKMSVSSVLWIMLLFPLFSRREKRCCNRGTQQGGTREMTWLDMCFLCSCSWRHIAMVCADQSLKDLCNSTWQFRGKKYLFFSPPTPAETIKNIPMEFGRSSGLPETKTFL